MHEQEKVDYARKYVGIPGRSDCSRMQFERIILPQGSVAQGEIRSY